MKCDRDRYLQLIEELHTEISFGDLDWSRLNNLKIELEALIDRVTPLKNRKLIDETKEILSQIKLK